MKRICLFVGLIIVVGYTHAQGLVPQPIPCTEPKVYTPGFAPGSNPVLDIQGYKCIDVFGPLTYGGPQVYEKGYTDMVAGEYIELGPGTDIGGFTPTDSLPLGVSPHYFDARIGHNDFEVVWFEPNNTPGEVGQYEKLELGVKLPSPIDSMVYSFLHPPGTTEWLNPFDSAAINVEAEFYYMGEHYSLAATSITKKVFGFYYEAFERSVVFDTLLSNDTWVEDSTSYPFRIRFAPPQTGNWAVKIRIKTPIGNYEVLPIYFKCTSSDNPGFVKLGSNPRYFMLGENTFIPIGTCLPYPTCYECTGPGEDAAELFQVNTMGSQGFEVYHNEMEDLHNNGGNYFRMFLTPAATDIEFEHLGNYGDRMNRAWEVDKILEKANELDLYIHFNMEIHYVLESPAFYDMFFWDWLPNSMNAVDPDHNAYYLAPWLYDEPDPGYCYKTELGLDDPIEFFSDANAIKYYKQKIRYMISRWGYSTNIALWELFSETDNGGSVIEKTVDYAHTIWSGHPFISDAYRPYWSDEVVPPVVQIWNAKMAKYIKVHLGHDQHLISAEYTGGPNDDERANNPTRNHSMPELSGPDVLLDDSYSDANIDVNCWSQYAGANIDRFNGLSQFSVPSRYINKPIMFAETGPNSEIPPLKIEDCDNNTEFVRSLWCTTFTGAAGPGLDWNSFSHDIHDTWKYYGVLRDFLSGNTFATESWEPAHDIRNDGLAEVFALVNSNEEEAMGVIVNRTYNFYTQGTGGCINITADPGSPYNSEANVIQYFPNATQHLKLNTMDPGDYIVNYYDALTGDPIGFSTPTVYPLIFDLFLEHPTLCLMTPCSDFRPLIAFKAEKIGGLKNLTTVIYDSISNYGREEISFEVMPNPASDEILVSVPQVEGSGRLTVLNGNGQVVLSIEIGQSMSINTSNWESGIYLVTLQGNNSYSTKKLVIQHEKN